MADYNVNMKQWNGTSFDNVLPLAYNAKALEGKTYDEIIQYLNDLVGTGGVNLRGEYGSYVGNNPNSWHKIITGFKPSFLIICRGIDSGDHVTDYALAIVTQAQLNETVNETPGFMGQVIHFTNNGFEVKNGAYNTFTSPQVCLNTQGRVYSYLAIK